MQNTSKKLFKLKNDTLNDTKKIIVPIQTRFVLRNYKSKKTGLSPIVLHVTQKGQRERISIDLHVLKKNWNPKKQRCRVDQDVNLIIDNLQKRITEIKTQYRLNHVPLSLDKFIFEFEKGFSRFDFIEFINQHIETESNISRGTYRRYVSVVYKMKSYQKTWLFSDIDNKFIDRYLNHLRSFNAENTVMSNLAVIKKYLRLALTYEMNIPIDVSLLKVREVKTPPRTLEIDELRKLWMYYFSDFVPSHQQLTLGYFLASCFTGLRVSDLLQIEREEKAEQYKIISQKNQKPLTINLSDKAKKIIDHHPGIFKTKLTPEYMNRKLKDIAKFLEIDKKLTMHVGRHTFATNYIRMNGNQTDLQNLLGHSSTRMTERYVSIAYEESKRNINIIDDIF